MSNEKKSTSPAEGRKSKKPYSNPAVRAYGNIRQITQATVRTGNVEDSTLGRPGDRKTAAVT